MFATLFFWLWSSNSDLGCHKQWLCPNSCPWEERRCVYRMGSRQLRSLVCAVSLEIRKHDIHILQFQQSFPRANVAIFGFPTVLHRLAWIHFHACSKVKLERRLFAESVLAAYRYHQWKGGKMITWCRKMMILLNDASKGLLSSSCFMLFFLVVQYLFCDFCWVVCAASRLFFSIGADWELWSRNCHVLALSETILEDYWQRHERFYLPWLLGTHLT